MSQTDWANVSWDKMSLELPSGRSTKGLEPRAVGATGFYNTVTCSKLLWEGGGAVVCAVATPTAEGGRSQQQHIQSNSKT